MGFSFLNPEIALFVLAGKLKAILKILFPLWVCHFGKNGKISFKKIYKTA